MNKETINKWTLLIVVFFISVVFLAMIRQFLMAIILAGIFSSLSYPMYRKFEIGFGGCRMLASAVTLILIIVVVLVPLSGLLEIITSQVVKVSTADQQRRRRCAVLRSRDHPLG
jgi:predicted PurR-regulated permease PerM